MIFNPVYGGAFGNDLVWISVIPTDLGAGSYLGGSNLIIGNTTYESYRCISIDLSLLEGKVVYIDNTANNRNFWGIFTATTNNAHISFPSTREQEQDGTLIFYTDDLYLATNARYLVYDYTSSSGNMPAVYAASVSGDETVTLITKTITANGTYNASSDNADGYSSVTVNVSGGGGLPLGIGTGSYSLENIGLSWESSAGVNT